MSSFDALLDSKIGSLGKWQLSLFFLVVIPSDIPISMVPQLANLGPDFVCSAPWFQKGWTFATVLNLSRTLADRLRENNSSSGPLDVRCHRFDLSRLPASAWNGSLDEQRSAVLDFAAEVNLSLQDCPGPWLYDEASARYRRSLIEEFDFVCARRGMIPNSAAMFVVGMMLGVLVGGQFGDHYGRRAVICSLYPLTALVTLLIPLSPTALVFFTMRTIIGFLSSMSYCCGYVYFLELSNYRHRNILCVIDGLVYYLLGQNVVNLASFLLQDWRWVHVVCGAITMVFSVLIFFFLPESPRWLVAQGRTQEALQILRKAALLNKGHAVPLSESDIADLSVTPTAGARNRGASLWLRVLTPLREWREFMFSRRALKRWVPLSFVWFGVASVFFGISFYGVRLSGNPYLVAFLMTITCIPTKLLQLGLYEKLNRKAPLVGLLAVTCLFCYISFVAMVTYGSSAALTIATATLSLSGLTTIFDMIYLVTAEIFSTLHRSKAIGFLSFCSRVGIIAGMFVERLEHSWRATPLLIFSIFSTIAVFSSAFLPTSDYDTMGDQVTDSGATDESPKCTDDKEEVKVAML